MQVMNVADVLQPYDLAPPDLEFLRPSGHQYTALLMQPGGPIFASAQRIGPAANALAAAKSRNFLGLARARNAHLVVTPEYYLPWSTLREAVTGGITPAADSLWVLGSESITQEELEQFKLDVADHCLVLHEPWADLAQDRSLLDPAVLLFQAIKPDQSTQLVALVQFKTYPSRDDTFFEEALLRVGTKIYKFSGRSGHLSAATIICSDAFSLEPAVLGELNYQSTIIHIQLNPSPTHSVYRKYRTTTFETDAKATNCHIVCLNWAHLVEEVNDNGVPKPWNNIAASTWYCPKDECSSKDDIVRANHRLGLYYTYMREHRHALRFHYEEAAFELLVPKLVRLAPAIMANRNGPSMVNRLVWDATQEWVTGPVPALDGSATYVATLPEANIALTHVLGTNDPLALERVLALSSGDISGRETWHSLESIDSCSIGPDEIVHRISVVLDTLGDEFRYRRISAIAEIHHELGQQTRWPKQVTGLDNHSTVQWSLTESNFNVRTSSGVPTLIVYLDETHSPRKRETKADKLYELLRRAGGEHQQRLCIIWRNHGQLQFVPIPALTRFDDANLDQTEFTSIHPLEPQEPENG